MNWAPSLSSAVIARALRASNGELGVRIADDPAFLEACETDGVELLGWELWLADHVAGDGRPRPAPGRWCSLLPVGGGNVVGGDGDRAATRTQLAGLDLAALVEARWRAHVRINFTLAD